MTPTCNVAFQKISHKQAVLLNPPNSGLHHARVKTVKTRKRGCSTKKGRKLLFNASHL